MDVMRHLNNEDKKRTERGSTFASSLDGLLRLFPLEPLARAHLLVGGAGSHKDRVGHLLLLHVLDVPGTLFGGRCLVAIFVAVGVQVDLLRVGLSKGWST